jgi:hypothetical protein
MQMKRKQKRLMMDENRIKDIKRDVLAKELEELKNIEKQHKRMNGKLYEEVAKLKKENEALKKENTLIREGNERLGIYRDKKGS